MENEPRKMYPPYILMFVVYLILVIAALILDSPSTIYRGLIRISTSRSVLITDYMAVGGIGATFINAAMVGSFGILMLYMTRVKPNGSIIMALWLTVGFAMFGKNIFNMLPLTFGVWLYAKVQKEPFINFSLIALLSATLSPVVSGISFHPSFPRAIGIPVGVVIGVIAGFIFPAVSAFTVRVHGGYNLYNMGFAGGLISTFVVAGLESVAVPMDSNLEWSQGQNFFLSILLYLLAAGLMLWGLFSTGKLAVPPYRKFTKHTGRVVTDFYILYGDSIYFNMGLLCALSTTIMLILGADLNGATMGGIFTIVGFGAFGKHLRNVIPLMLGAVVSTYVNMWDPTSPTNILAILFSTGLAPIAGQFGAVCGFIAGFIHVNLVMHIGVLNSGLNLYNNGYAAGLVALLLVPVISAFQQTGGNSHEAVLRKKFKDHK